MDRAGDAWEDGSSDGAADTDDIDDTDAVRAEARDAESPDDPADSWGSGPAPAGGAIPGRLVPARPGLPSGAATRVRTFRSWGACGACVDRDA